MSKNTTQIKAAVVREKGGPFSIEILSLEGPRRDEVLVKVVATGLCHTDMVARDKGYPVPHPIVLGHVQAGRRGVRGQQQDLCRDCSVGRHGTPEDVAGLVSYLLSDDSTYATGTTHSVDGGFTTA
jgi:D-arabinose 1-dehydrogenase-like Zn-dependent alcohol dehydrogenase